MGKYSDLFANAPTAVGKIAPEAAELASAVSSAQYRIGSSPAIASSGKYADLFKNIENIAAGKKQPSRGLLGAIQGGFQKGLEGIGYVLGTPVRATASLAKEITDVVEGRGFSPTDLVKQVADKNFYPSTLIPKSGNKWLDSVTGFAADVLGDPTTYVTFGASAWTGKAGRLALAAKAAESATLAKAPGLANKLEEIARLGVHADLTDVERAVLNAPRGVSWTYGARKGQVIGREGTVTRRLSEELSTIVGKPTARLRATIGDVPFLEPVQKAVFGKSIRDADLIALGRRGKPYNPNEIVEKLAGYSAAQRGKAMARSFISRIGSTNQELAKEISQFESSTGLRVAHFIEDETLVPPPEALDIVNKTKAFLADVRKRGNDVAGEFSVRRGVRTFLIEQVDNYVPHTLSEDARAWLASKRWRGTPNETYIKNVLDLSPDEFSKGPAVMRARKLKPAEPGQPPVLWLGEEIKTGSIREINDITERKLGFKWFEEDGATYLNSYINSVGNQVKRVGFADRLFDYGVDVVRATNKVLQADPEVAKAWGKVTRQWENMLKGVISQDQKLGAQAAGVMGKATNVARQVIQDNNRKLIFSQQEIGVLEQQLSQIQYFLDVATQRAAQRGGVIQQEFEAVAAPLRARVAEINQALASNDQLELAAVMYLEEAHARMFPRMKNRPTDPRVMAEQILAKSESTTTSRLKALETRRNRLARSVGPRGRKTKLAEFAGEQADLAKAEREALDSEIELLNEVVQNASEDFPNGVYYVSRADLDMAASGGKAGIPVYNELPAGASIDDFIISLAPDLAGSGSQIIRPLDNWGHYVDFVSGIGDGIGYTIARLGDRQGAEFFDEMWSMAMRSQRGGVNALDPTWVDMEPELAGVIAIADRMGRKYADEAAFEGTDSAARLAELNQDIEDIGMLMDDWLGRQIAVNGAPDNVFDDGYDMLAEAISEIGNPTSGGMSGIIGVNLEDIILGGAEAGTILSRDYAQNTLNEVPDAVAQALSGGKMDPTMRLLAAQGEREATIAAYTAQKDMLDAAVADIKATRAEAARVGRQAGGVKTSAQRLQGRVREAGETVRRASEEVEIPDGKGGTRVVTREEAVKQLNKDAKKIASDEKKLARAIADDPLTKEAQQAEGIYNKVEASLNASKAVRGQAADWEQSYGAAYRDDLQQLERLLADQPPKGASAEVVKEWNTQVQRVFEQIRNPQIFTEPQRDALERIFLQKRGLEAQVAMLEQYVDFGKLMFAKAQTGEVGGRLVDDILDGWVGIESMGIQMPPQVRDMLFGRIESLRDPKEFNKFLDAYFRYQRFFKVTAMLTPGFIVRNAMTAAFNNFVAGVTLAETAEGIRFSQNALKFGVEKALEMVPAGERRLYNEAYNVVMATGAGQTADDFFYPIASTKGQRWLNSKPVTKWRNRNEQVEMAARMSLALSSLRRDLGFDGAAAQVNRYHFDYTDLSKLDEVAKTVVPFWTFATRNIPLQLMNQIARPGLYRAYDSLERNFEPDSSLVLAPWMVANRPISGPGGRIFMPDLPFIDMENQLRMFADPMRLASQLNPIPRLGIELMGDRQLGLDIPFSEKPYEVRGPLDIPAAIGGALFGQTGTNAEGQLTTSSKAGYALPALLPTLAQLQRLIPQAGGKETYIERQPYSILSATTGIPLRGVTETEQANELIRRQFALRDLLSNLTRQGYLEPRS